MDKENYEVTSFLRKVKKEFNPEKIILFGSRARGDNFTYSDYDFIIIADSFKNIKWLDKISRLVRHWNLDKDIDVLPYTKKEFERKKDFSIIKNALQHGKEITA